MNKPEAVPTGLRILVCGGRRYGMPTKNTATGFLDFEKAEKEERFLNRVLTKLAPKEIIAGDALGADKLALAWAKGYRVKWQMFPADWDSYGYSAGPIRNQRMLTQGKPDLVVAFPGGKGTANMCGLARQAKVRVITPVRGHEPVSDEGYTISPFVRKLLVDRYAMTGYHCETATRLYPDGVPPELQEECEAAHVLALATQESEAPAMIEDPVGKYRNLLDHLLAAREERNGELPGYLEDLFLDNLDRYWWAMSEDEQAQLKDVGPVRHTAEHT